jgi:hypothetical protein
MKPSRLRGWARVESDRRPSCDGTGRLPIRAVSKPLKRKGVNLMSPSTRVLRMRQEVIDGR